MRTLRQLSVVLIGCCALSLAAQNSSAAKDLFDQERWPEVVQLLHNIPDRSAEEEYEYGIALAHLEKWPEARQALLRGSRLKPRDKRFPIELAGVAFKQKNSLQAIGYLRRALRLDGKDDYANDFLATVYFLQGNSEAAVKYWNQVGKPQIAALRNEPPLRVRPALLDRALAYSPASVLQLDELRATQARLDHLDLFSSYRIDLVARADGKFDSVLRARELNGFGNSTAEALLRTFRGVPFLEVTPEYDNLHGSAINFTSLARWDPDKRRYTASVSGLLRQNPQWRVRLGGDFRNENWQVRQGFTGPAPVLASLNLRREALGAEVARLVGWRLRWSLGAEFSHRDFRNVVPGTVLPPALLAQGYQIKQKARLSYEWLRSPERRLTISSGVTSEASRLWSQPGESSEKLQGLLEAHWFPHSRGDDLETLWRIRGGTTFGQVPFDELFMLGVERDNDLWLRGHIGTRSGRKGSAPLGRGYFLSNWEMDKNIYDNGLISVKLGPFVDTAKMADPIVTLTSNKWLWDTGAQAKLRVLGVGVAFIYGKDLRTGNNGFYATVTR